MVIPGIVAAVAAVPAAALMGTARAMLPKVMGRKRQGETPDELGDWLGAGGDVLVTRQPGLSDEERSVIEWNRAKEAASTWSWLRGLPGGMCFEDVWLEAEDGVQLCGHVLRCRPGSGRWLVFAHGFEGTWRAGMSVARHFAEEGFNLLFVEMRAHGASGGRWVGSGWLDRRDLVAWCAWVSAGAGGGASVAPPKIVLMGESMGAASCLMAAGEKDLPSEVVACVSDCAFSTWEGVSHRILVKALGEGRRALVGPLFQASRLALRMSREGYDCQLSRPVDALARSRVGVLLIHGDRDDVVPVEMAHELSRAGTGHELLVVPAAGHCTSCFANPDAYFGRIRAFLAPRL